VDGLNAMSSVRRGAWARNSQSSRVSRNDYLFASAFITNRNLYTAGLGIATFISQENVRLYQLMAAGVVLSLLPVILYMSVQRQVARGLTAGAVK
jgi:multiple sugar transport system permease protein